MPFIPQYEQRVSASVGAPLPSSSGLPVSSAVGEGLSRLGQAGNQMVTALDQAAFRDQQEQKHRQDQINKAWAGEAASDQQLKWLQNLDERKRAAPPGAPGFTKSLLDDFNESADAVIKMAPNEDSRNYLQQHLTALRTHLGTQAIAFQDGAEVVAAKQMNIRAIDNQALLVAQNPAAFDQAMNLVKQTRPSVGPQADAELDIYATRTLTHAAAGAAVVADPVGAQDLLGRALKRDAQGKDGEPVKTGVGWVDAMPVADKLHFLQQANAAVARISAMGDRTEAEMDQQVSTGIPASADQLMKWKANATKAGRPELFTEYVNNEAKVQSVLTLPIAEQAKTAETVMTDLQTKGGDPKQIANAKRLVGAIQANIKMANDNPLGYAALRYGQQTEPLTMTDFNGPDAAVKIGTKLQARADILNANKLPLNLLKPEEAQAVGDMLQQLDPKTAGKTFGMFRNAAGNDQNYMALMQQVGNGTKPEAYAGMLYAKLQNANVSGGLFGKDQVLTADQVATTMVTGARILNQTSGKGDGTDKKQVSLYLPDEKEFQNKFASLVGDAFAGSPDAARNALNMTRTYYAGRAAEKGIIAADKTLGSVNSDLIKEAFAVTIGDVAGVGTGKVVPPYGMKAADFEQQARDQFARIVGDAHPQIWNSVTLRAIGQDKYLVLAGDQAFRTGPDKPPVILDMGAGRDYARDRFGRSNPDLIPQ